MPLGRAGEPTRLPTIASLKQNALPQNEARIPAQTFRVQEQNREPVPPQSAYSNLNARKLYQQAEALLFNAQAEIKKGAVLSARESSTGGLQYLSQAVQLMRPESNAYQRCQNAFVAMQEVGDFLGRYGAVDGEAVRRTVQSHQTTALKDVSGKPLVATSKMTGFNAAERYLEVARQNLQSFCQGDPIGARLLGALAESYDWKAQQSSDAGDEWIALTLIRTASDAFPQDAKLNATAGRLLARQGLLTEAQKKYEASMNLKPDVITARQLAVVAKQRGDARVAADAEGYAARVLANGPPRKMEVIRLSPEEFAQISPRALIKDQSNPAGLPRNPHASASPRQWMTSQQSTAAKTESGNPLKRISQKFTNLFR